MEMKLSGLCNIRTQTRASLKSHGNGKTILSKSYPHCLRNKGLIIQATKCLKTYLALEITALKHELKSF